MGDADRLSEGEFETWVPLPSAVTAARERLSFNKSREEIARRLIAGQLVAAARSSTWYDETDKNRTDDRPREKLAAMLWKSCHPPESHDDCWTTASRAFYQPTAYGRSDLVVQCFGLRVDPVGLKQLLIDIGAETPGISADRDDDPSAVRKQDLPILPPLIAEAWMQWYKSHANPSQDGAVKSAANMFPNHNLSRERIRELFGPTARGRPTKTVP
jgi:hypothetical protein